MRPQPNFGVGGALVYDFESAGLKTIPGHSTIATADAPGVLLHGGLEPVDAALPRLRLLDGAEIVVALLMRERALVGFHRVVVHNNLLVAGLEEGHASLAASVGVGWLARRAASLQFWGLGVLCTRAYAMHWTTAQLH